jgi:hypothetical protein
VPVYDLLMEEAGDGAEEECEGRGQRRIKKHRAAEESRMMDGEVPIYRRW